jgi:DHA1 family tetracycline resistance protein-like MFS transporter
MPHSAASPSSRSALLPIFLIVLVDILGLTLILPLLPFYAQTFQASPIQVGLLATSYAACQLISGPILGSLSDRFGRKPLLIVSQLGTLAGFILMAMANSLPLLFLSRVIDGATAGNLSLAQAYISDVTTEKNRTQSFALIGIAFGLGFLFGPAISGYLSQYGIRTPIFAAAGLSATSILATFLLLPGDQRLHQKKETPEAAPAPGTSNPGLGKRLGLLSWGRYFEFFRRPELSRPLQEFFLFTFGFSLFTTGFALFAERRLKFEGQPFGPREVGYVFAFSGLLGIILQGGLIGRLSKVFGDEKLARAGFIACMIAYAGLATVESIPFLLMLSAIASFGSGSLRPTLTSIVSRKAARHEQGVVLGLLQSLNSVSQITAPLVAGALIGKNWLAAWALTASFASGLGFFLSKLAPLSVHDSGAFPRKVET